MGVETSQANHLAREREPQSLLSAAPRELGWKRFRLKLLTSLLVCGLLPVALVCAVLLIKGNVVGITWLGLLVGASIGLAAFAFSTAFSRGLAQLQKATDRMRRGDLETRVQIRSGDEWQALGQTFNHLAGQLKEAVTARQSLGQKLAAAEQQLAHNGELAERLEKTLRQNRALEEELAVAYQNLAANERLAEQLDEARHLQEATKTELDTVSRRLASAEAVAASVARRLGHLIEVANAVREKDYEVQPLAAAETVATDAVAQTGQAQIEEAFDGLVKLLGELKQEREALEWDHFLFSTLMENIPDTIYFKDTECRYLKINRAHANKFGLKDPSEAVGKNVFDYFTKDHAQPAYDDEQLIIRAGIPVIGKEEKETSEKGEEWVSTTKLPLRNRQGEAIGLFGISRDITERKRVEIALQEGLAEFLNFVAAVSQGDLTRRGRVGEGELGAATASVNRMLDNFSAMLARVKTLALSVSSGATEILAASEQMATGAERQANEITDTSSAVEEMATSMTQVSKNAEAAAEGGRRALTMAERGDKSVRDTSEAMSRIDSGVSRTAEKMQTLTKRSSEITEILELIDDIAAQTNLLALNAAIEAAHAGETGLGFSVVAEEIRKLAERSTRATRDVGNLIKAIQRETEEARVAMEGGLQEVNQGSRLAEQGRQSLQDISSVVKLSADLIEEISAASEEQARVTRSLVSTMQTVSSITQQTSACAHETARSMQSMVELAENLNEAISQFKVE